MPVNFGTTGNQTMVSHRIAITRIEFAARMPGRTGRSLNLPLRILSDIQVLAQRIEQSRNRPRVPRPSSGRAPIARFELDLPIADLHMYLARPSAAQFDVHVIARRTRILPESRCV